MKKKIEERGDMPRLVNCTNTIKEEMKDLLGATHKKAFCAITKRTN